MVKIVSVSITGLLIEREPEAGLAGASLYPTPRVAAATTPEQVERSVQQSLQHYFSQQGLYADLKVEVEDPQQAVEKRLVYPNDVNDDFDDLDF